MHSKSLGVTQLLISVTNLEEAQIALENGTDIIDLKDPSAGALGALPIDQIKSIVDFVNAKKQISATIGDLPMQSEIILPRVFQLLAIKIDYIKIGFFETTDYLSCLQELKKVTQSGAKLIAVLFAESIYPESLIAEIKEAGFIGVMLDTAKKNGLTLMDYYSEDKRYKFAKNVLSCGLTFGLAGSLNLKHVAALKILNPTYIGFRGGVCNENQRELSLDAEKISAIRKTL